MTNDITILSCPQCGFPLIRDCGNGLYQCDDCGTHFDKNENIVLTEQEYLQTCTTEQLAEWLARITNAGYLLALRMKYHCDDVDAVREWLKQPHKEGE